MYIKYLLGSILLFVSSSALAQEVLVTEHIFNENFFATVIAGVILALCIQFILTALSVAVGITSMGDLKQQFVESSHSITKSGEPNERDEAFDGVETPAAVKVTTGFGVWSVLTTCVALFVSTTIALNLTGVTTQEAIIATSLVIWGLFFIILFFFEAKIAKTLIGGLIGTATAGFKASGSAVKSLFTPSKQKQLDKMLKTSIDRIRAEVSGMDYTAISEAVEKFEEKLDKKVPDYSDLKSDLQEQSRQSATKNSVVKWVAIERVLSASIEKNSKLNSSDAQKKVKAARKVLAELKEAYQSGDDTFDGIKNAVSKFTELDKKEIDEKIEEFKQKLATMLPEDFEKEDLKDQIGIIINDPKVLVNAANNEFKKIDKESIVSYLNENTSIEKEKIEQYADKVDDAIKKIAAEFDKENDDRLIARMESSIENFFNSTGRPELRYESLKDDFARILDNPKESLEVIKSRIALMDGESVRAVITNNPYVDDAHIDRIVNSFNDAKSAVSEKISKIEERSIQQYQMLKRKAVIKAEHARKTASVAAWWLVITAISSAGAAVAGGLV